MSDKLKKVEVIKKAGYPKGTTSTGISCNGSYLGRTIIAITSTHQTSGDATESQVVMLRCGYDGNHLTETVIAETRGAGLSRLVSFGTDSNGNITVICNANPGVQILFISNKEF